MSLVIFSTPSVNALDKSVKEIGADILNDVGITGKRNTICLIDDGVDYTHENLGGCTEAQFLSGTCGTVVAGINILDNDFDILPKSDQYHGTHIAGILISNDSNYKGVAPDTKLAVVKAYSNVNNAWSCQGFIDAITWCSGKADQYNITAISFSQGLNLCSSSYSTQFQTAINNATEKGILFVKSSGNSLSDLTMTFPAELGNVTTAGSTTKDEISSFTRREPTSRLDVLAPGHKIRSTKTGGGLSPFLNELLCVSDSSTFLYGLSLCNSGTSYAAPHVAAASALLTEFDSALKPFDVERILMETGDDIYDPVTDTNFKKINLLNAFGILDWPTDHHDYRRTGFTLLKGDIVDSSDVDKVQVALKGDVSSETVVRPSIADLDGNGRQDVVSILHNATNDHESDVYRVQKKKFFSGYRTEWQTTLNPASTGGGSILLPPSLGDINSDSDREIIVGMRNGTIFALNPEDGSIKWIYELEGRLSPFSGQTGVELGGGSVIADIDLDGKNEVIFADKASSRAEYDWPGKVYVLEDNGASATLEDSAEFGNGGAFGSISVANLDSDDEMEIVVPSFYGISVYDYDAASGLSIKWNNSDGLIDGSAVIYDVDRDNEYELIYSTTTYLCSSSKSCLNKTYVRDAATGDLELSINLPVISRVTPVIANLDSDSALEIVISGQNSAGADPAIPGKILAYDASTGSQEWSYDDGGSLQVSFVSPDIADIDNDGNYNILFGENNGTDAYILNNDGTLSFKYDFESFIDSALAIADIDGDGRAEIALKKAGSPVSLLAVTSSSNDPPVLGAIDNVTAIAGSLIDLNASGTVLASDPENNTLTFAYSSPFNSSGLWQTTVNDTGNYSILVEVDDGNLTDFTFVNVFVFKDTTLLQSNFTTNLSYNLFNFTEAGNKSLSVRLHKDAQLQFARMKLKGMSQ